MQQTFGHSMHQHWMLRDSTIFLNHGSFGATPRVVMQEQRRWMERFESQPVEFVKRVLPGALREAAGMLASFLHANADDVVFVDNASTGVSTVIHSLIPILRPGDELLTTTHVYNAVRMTMQHVCSLVGAKVVEVEVPFPVESPTDFRQALLAGMTERTRFVIIDHVTSPTGLVVPLDDIIADCHARGILVMIDGAHAPGMLPLNLNALSADWYTGNFHKWLYAPNGCAFLWTRKDHQAMTHPLVPSHGYGQGYITEFDFVGTRDWSTTLAAPAGLQYFERLGVQAIREYNSALTLDARRLLLELYPQPLPCPESMLAFMATIVLPIVADDPFSVCESIHDRLLDEHKIEVPLMPLAGKVLLRVSAQVYNELSDYEYLCQCLPKVLAHV